MKYSDIPKRPEPQPFKLICKYCRRTIYGGKGDYWHTDTNLMQCKGGTKLAYPTAWTWMSNID